MPTPFVAMRIPFPVFAVTSMADKEKRNIVAVSGGGGELKYGIKNAVEFYRLKSDGSREVIDITPCGEINTDEITPMMLSRGNTPRALLYALFMDGNLRSYYRKQGGQWVHWEPIAAADSNKVAIQVYGTKAVPKDFNDIPTAIAASASESVLVVGYSSGVVAVYRTPSIEKVLDAVQEGDKPNPGAAVLEHCWCAKKTPSFGKTDEVNKVIISDDGSLVVVISGMGHVTTVAATTGQSKSKKPKVSWKLRPELALEKGWFAHSAAFLESRTAGLYPSLFLIEHHNTQGARISIWDLTNIGWQTRSRCAIKDQRPICIQPWYPKHAELESDFLVGVGTSEGNVMVLGGIELRRLFQRSAHFLGISGITVSPDAQYLATSSVDQNLSVIDVSKFSYTAFRTRKKRRGRSFLFLSVLVALLALLYYYWHELMQGPLGEILKDYGM